MKKSMKLRGWPPGALLQELQRHWGLLSLAAAAAGYAFSPLYRGLTFQFKVFLQMSGMTAGAIIDADRRLIAHEAMVRNRKKLARDAEVWRRYEEDYQQLLDEANKAPKED